MIKFEYPEFLYALSSLLIFIGIFIFTLFRRKILLSKFVNLQFNYLLFNEMSKYKPYVKLALWSIAFASLIFAMANPLLGTKLIEARRTGVDVVVAIDVSNSMKAEDIKPNRLERAKQMVAKLIDNLKGDRIGLIVFAGESFVQLPITTDYGAAKLFLSYIDTDIVPVQGTAIGSAINLAVEKFNFDEKKKKVLIVITDGENHEDDAIASAIEATKHNFVIHTIGMGTLNGGPIPIYRNGVNVGFLKDANGSVVTTKVDPIMLEKIATAGGGEFLLNTGIDPDLSKIVDKIEQMEKQEFKSKIYSSFESQYQYPLAFAFLLLLFELLTTEKRNPYLFVLSQFVQRGGFRNAK
ncbi:MAG: vWA domain-containing protein [Candidatus Kapaibacteriales bacterium]